MSKLIRAAGRVLVVLFLAGVIGGGLFAAMQLVVHPLMGPPRRQQFNEGQRPAFQPGGEDERRPEGNEGRLPRRFRPYMLRGLVARGFLFLAVTLGVVVVQKLFFSKPKRRSPPA